MMLRVLICVNLLESWSHSGNWFEKWYIYIYRTFVSPWKYVDGTTVHGLPMSGSLKLWMPRLVDCTQRLQQAAEKEPPSSWDGLQVAALGPPGKGKVVFIQDCSMGIPRDWILHQGKIRKKHVWNTGYDGLNDSDQQLVQDFCHREEYCSLFLGEIIYTRWFYLYVLLIRTDYPAFK